LIATIIFLAAMLSIQRTDYDLYFCIIDEDTLLEYSTSIAYFIAFILALFMSFTFRSKRMVTIGNRYLALSLLASNRITKLKVLRSKSQWFCPQYFMVPYSLYAAIRGVQIISLLVGIRAIGQSARGLSLRSASCI
jgi:hypothetical protein